MTERAEVALARLMMQTRRGEHLNGDEYAVACQATGVTPSRLSDLLGAAQRAVQRGWSLGESHEAQIAQMAEQPLPLLDIEPPSVSRGMRPPRAFGPPLLAGGVNIPPEGEWWWTQEPVRSYVAEVDRYLRPQEFVLSMPDYQEVCQELWRFDQDITARRTNYRRMMVTGEAADPAVVRATETGIRRIVETRAAYLATFIAEHRVAREPVPPARDPHWGVWDMELAAPDAAPPLPDPNAPDER